MLEALAGARGKNPVIALVNAATGRAKLKTTASDGEAALLAFARYCIRQALGACFGMPADVRAWLLGESKERNMWAYRWAGEHYRAWRYSEPVGQASAQVALAVEKYAWMVLCPDAKSQGRGAAAVVEATRSALRLYGEGNGTEPARVVEVVGRMERAQTAKLAELVEAKLQPASLRKAAAQ